MSNVVVVVVVVVVVDDDDDTSEWICGVVVEMENGGKKCWGNWRWIGQCAVWAVDQWERGIRVELEWASQSNHRFD